MRVQQKWVFLAMGLLAASPAAACVKDVAIGSDVAHDTDGDHPPFAVCPSGVACGRCGQCSDCGFCQADPKGAPCEKASDCPNQLGYYVPFATCFADPAFDPDAAVADGVSADAAIGGTALPPPQSANACSASRRPGSGASGLVVLAVVCLLARRRYLRFF